MAKINIKNSIRNPLISYLKENNIEINSINRILNGDEIIEKIKISTTKPEFTRGVMEIIENYGNQLYHDTTLTNTMKLNNFFNYSTNDYEKTTIDIDELSLPNFYVENVNDQNLDSVELKSLNVKTITKNYIENISRLQNGLNPRDSVSLSKYKNIVFGNNYSPSRSYETLNNFPYYNSVTVFSSNGERKLSELLKKISFQEEMLSAILSISEAMTVNFTVNQVPVDIDVKDLNDTLGQTTTKLSVDDKIILGNSLKNSSFMVNNFKKNIILSSIRSNILIDTLSFSEMYQTTECKNETLVYRIDKFKDNDSEPIQTFWTYNGEVIYDYQIKRDNIYRYKLSCYCLIYGTQTTIIDNIVNGDGVTLTIRTIPSYKYTLVNFGEQKIKVSPKILLPPFVNFFNENNEENKIKLYLSLKNGSRSDKFVEILQEDSQLIDGIKSDDGLREFSYEVQDGKFEVYRMSERPKTYQSFSENKTLDVNSTRGTTDVIFTDSVRPNQKYYYMFRSINFIGLPSNPTPVYEVELVKNASTSKVLVSTITLDEEEKNKDKTFKSLIQIKPAFQQDIFDDQEELVSSLPTFKKKIFDMTLGNARDKVWGKKFKIRVKSNDSGKIIDLNVKFNLIKDNIK